MKLKGNLTKPSGAAALLAAVVLSQSCGGASPDAASAGRVGRETVASQRNANSQPNTAAPALPQVADSHDGHSHGPQSGSGAAESVPAFAKTAAELRGLAPVLPARQFVGKARMAYQAVAEIPQTVAQLPCYCHCDRGFGHKSLHSCFVDDHASHCAVCVDEALLAHRLQKQEGLSPEKIREAIIAQYSREH